MLQRKEKVTVLVQYFRLQFLIFTVFLVFFHERFTWFAFPDSWQGQVESPRRLYGIMPVHYEFWSSMKRRNERPDSCFEPYALTSTTRVGCCFLSFFFQESAERIDALTISLSYRTARRWWARTDTSVKLKSPHSSAVFDLQQIFSSLPVCTLFDDVFVLKRLLLIKLLQGTDASFHDRILTLSRPRIGLWIWSWSRALLQGPVRIHSDLIAKQSILTPMMVPPDLQPHLHSASKRRETFSSQAGPHSGGAASAISCSPRN